MYKEYIKVFKSAISEKTCNEIVAELQNCNWTKNEVYVDANGVAGASANPDAEDDIPNPDTSYDVVAGHQEVMNSLFEMIQKYQNELTANRGWNSWQGYTSLKYNKYEEGSNMDYHVGHIHSIFDNDYGVTKGVPILSIVGVLNNDFEGGAFTMFDDYEINLDMGDVVLFPSSFVFPHKVNTIEKGTRYSFVSWVF